MDQKIATFPYNALDTTKSEIRLIHLQPGWVTDGIKCELILASLNYKSTYEALSYEWGPPCPDVFGIKLSGQEDFVRENLWLRFVVSGWKTAHGLFRLMRLGL